MDELQEEQDEEGDSSENDSDDEQEAAGTQQPNSNGGSAPTATTSSHENGSEPTSSRGAGPDIDADLDFEAGPMSTPEQQVLVACRQLMDVGGRSLKALSKCLLEGEQRLDELRQHLLKRYSRAAHNHSNSSTKLRTHFQRRLTPNTQLTSYLLALHSTDKLRPFTASPLDFSCTRPAIATWRCAGRLGEHPVPRAPPAALCGGPGCVHVPTPGWGGGGQQRAGAA